MMMQFSFKGQRLFPDANNNGKKNGIKSDKYQLRPRGRTRDITRSNSPVLGDENKPRSSTSRPRSAPLSKYRRKTANARERSRMREINQAFEALRRCVPQWAAAPCTPQQEKLTKITTLRLAMKYIGSLTAALRDPTVYSNMDCFLESDDSSTGTMHPSECSLPDSPFVSSSDCYSPPGSLVHQIPDASSCLSTLDLDSSMLLQDTFSEPVLTADTLSQYFLP